LIKRGNNLFLFLDDANLNGPEEYCKSRFPSINITPASVENNPNLFIGQEEQEPSND